MELYQATFWHDSKSDALHMLKPVLTINWLWTVSDFLCYLLALSAASFAAQEIHHCLPPVRIKNRLWNRILGRISGKDDVAGAVAFSEL